MKRKRHFYSLLENPPARTGYHGGTAFGSRCGIEEGRIEQVREMKYWRGNVICDEQRSRRRSTDTSDTQEITSMGVIRQRVDFKPELGLPMDILLNSISGHEKGVRFNFNLINSMILKFIDHKKLTSLLSIEPIFRFAKTLPLTLISGYIYLERYVNRIRTTFSDCSRFIKLFLVCCFIGSKFTHDTHCSNDSFMTDLSITAKEINYIEGFVLSTINYDIEISNRDIQRVFLQNSLPSSKRKNLDACFHEAINCWRK